MIDRRRLLSLIGMSPAILAGSRPEAQTQRASHKMARGQSAHAVKVAALNPKGTPPPIQLIPMAPRLSTLDGKTIYLISDGFPGADQFLDQISIWFKRNMPSVKTVYRLKAGALPDDDPKLWAEVKDKGNAVIMAIGH